jgi:hypothetical protein
MGVANHAFPGLRKLEVFSRIRHSPNAGKIWILILKRIGELARTRNPFR